MFESMFFHEIKLSCYVLTIADIKLIKRKFYTRIAYPRESTAYVNNVLFR